MSDGMVHLYSRLEKLAHGVQKVGHPWSRIFYGAKYLQRIHFPNWGMWSVFCCVLPSWSENQQ